MKETISTLSHQMSLMLSELCHGQDASIEQLACLEMAIHAEIARCVFTAGAYVRLTRRGDFLINAPRIRRYSESVVSTLSYVYRRKVSDFDFVLSQIDSDILSVLFVEGVITEATYLRLFDQKLDLRLLASGAVKKADYYNRALTV